MNGLAALFDKLLTHQRRSLSVDLDSHVSDTGMKESEIRAVQESRYWTLRFPAELELTYRSQYAIRALRTYRLRTPFILLLYLVVVVGVIQALPPHALLRFILIDIWIPLILIGGWFLTLIKSWARWYQCYTAMGSMLVLATTIIVANVFKLGEGLSFAYAAIMFTILIVYSYVGLHFLWALAAGWFGGVLGVELTYYLGGDVSWSLFHRTYTCTSVLGMGIAYALDRQERHNFLQMCLLQIAVTKSARLAQRLEDLSRTDALTGLANRRTLDETLTQEWNRASRHQQPLTLMMLDVDHFKPYNDQFGHVAGDACLREVAALLSSLTGRSGELAARYGGEEFALIYPMMTATVAEHHAQKILDQMQALALPGTHGHVTLSIGIASSVWSATANVDTLLRHADDALYLAKRNGRNCYVFYPVHAALLTHVPIVEAKAEVCYSKDSSYARQ